MESYKKIADIIITSPEDKDKVKEILENAEISVLDGGLVYSIIEKVEE